MRCGDECSNELYDIPAALFEQPRTRETPLTFEESQLLKCPKCGEDSRPHVLWFDETYNEKFYKLESSIRVARSSGILFVIGTSGATNLPQQLVAHALTKNGIVIDINPNDDVFTADLNQSKNGYVIKETSTVALSEIYDFIEKCLGN